LGLNPGERHDFCRSDSTCAETEAYQVRSPSCMSPTQPCFFVSYLHRSILFLIRAIDFGFLVSGRGLCNCCIDSCNDAYSCDRFR
jgi:hypothetical protein